MITKISIQDFSPLLDVEKYGRLYMLKDVKKLDFGYRAKLSILKKEFNVLVKAKSSSLEIMEEGGKFVITVSFKGNEVVVEFTAISPLYALLTPVEFKISKNIETYAKDICSRATRQVSKKDLAILEVFRTVPSKTLDLRGTVCPVPEIEAKKAILSSRPFEPIEVLVDHPAAILYTLPEVARVFNCRYEVRNMGDYASFVFICGRKEGNLKLDLSDVKNVMRSEGEIARLYLYFDKVVKEVKVDKITSELFEVEGTKLIVASPEGREWLLTSLFEGPRLLGARLDYGNVKLFDEDALNSVIGYEGLTNVYYLEH
ncbi:MAG: sulfurtransferase TusA family protein [Candidatus Aramenus sulfurataquae]|jgi:TusA-related sulfurtransferase|uniref:Sulfurtransferase TusA family protein n=1 Tax=Candidatus Aramenus sulfurataquae TaxID=1326980 RepID=A0ACC6TR90_9CREN